MRNKIYLLALLLLLMHLPTLAQIGGDYNPSNPGDPGTPVLKYTLSLKASPANAGSFNVSSTQLSVGESFTIKAYSNQTSNPGFQFVAWVCDGDTISKSASYTITMPAHDLEIIGVYKYDPSNPSDPDDPVLKYTLSLKASPANAGSFNISSTQLSVGEDITIKAYSDQTSNSGFQFVAWVCDGDTISKSASYNITMPAHDLEIIGVYKYDPSSPANPNANYWNSLTGEVIVDDFQPGKLSNAISALLNRYGANKNDVQSIIVAGQMTSNDFGIANTYTNCAILDLSRVTGISEIPTYAFDYTNLESVYLPTSIEKIGNSAFYQCTKLYSLTVYAMTPPHLGSNVFTGVPEGLVVYVPAAALTLYQNDPNWNKYILLPIQDGIRSLTVNLPSSANPADYTHMWLELTNTKNGQRMHLVMTDKMSYKFNNIIRNTTWDVVLRNPNGDIFGQIENVEVGEEDVTVTFASLSKPYSVSLSVLTPSGQDVTSQAEITWTDADCNYLTQESSIAGLPLGYQLIYSVKLPQELAMAYIGPSDTHYTVKNGNNSIVCHLTAISNLTVSGKVKDSNTGLPLKGANVTASQTFGGKYDKTISATTNNSGEFTFEIAKVPTVFGASATDYINKSVAFDVMAATGNIVLPDLSLDPITGATISVGFTYTPCHASDEEAEPQNWYSDFNNVDYSIYNKTKNRPIGQFSAQYPQIVLLEDVNDGDVLELTASSRKDAFKPVKATVTIDEQKANATFNIIELGKIAASFKNSSNPTVMGTLYDGNGKLVDTYNYRDAALEISDLNDGNYTLISMGESRFFNTIYDMTQFSQSGLVSGVDYVRTAVQVQSGIISKVEINNVPLFDESKFYYTGENTSLTANKTSLTIGNYLTLTGHLDFKPVYASQVDNVQMIIDLPESCTFVENSVMVGNSTSGYSFDSNRIIIPMARYTDRVRFCVIPTVGGNYSPSALVRFDINGKTITQPIGNTNYIANNLSISLPSKVANSRISINGSAVGQCRVSIIDNGVLIGETTSLANGDWSCDCELYDCYQASNHVIYAKVFSQEGLELHTDAKTCTYDENFVQVSKVKMYYSRVWRPNDYEVTFDFLNPSESSEHYSYDMTDQNKKFTFTIEFTNNKSASNVTLYVKTAKNHWWPLKALYDNEKDLWVTEGEFGDSQDGDLPVTVAVDYDTPIVLDSLTVIGTIKNFYNDVTIEDFSLQNNILTYKLIPKDASLSIRCVYTRIPLDQKDILYDKLNNSCFSTLVYENDSLKFYLSDNYSTQIIKESSDSVIVYASFDCFQNEYFDYLNILQFGSNQSNEISHKPKRILNGDPLDDSIYEFPDDDAHRAQHLRSNLDDMRNARRLANNRLSCAGGDDRASIHSLYWQFYDITAGRDQGFLGAIGTLLNNHHGNDPVSQLIGLWDDGNNIPNYIGSIRELNRQAQERLRDIYNYPECPEDDGVPTGGAAPISDPMGFIYTGPEKTFCIDPSGFVYEGVPSNRLEGVTTTCYYKQMVEDMYGDLHEEVVLWDAEQYGQKNPLITNEEGFYRWDVPVGMWQVKYEKAGYETTYSDWLPVPPPQLDVNIGMTQMRQPGIIKARAYTKAVEFEFDKYMKPETLTTDNISVVANGVVVNGTIQLLNEEQAYDGDETFASRVRFNATSPFNADEVTLHVCHKVKNYAGISMSDDYEQSLDVEYEIEKIDVDTTIYVIYGNSRQLTVTVEPARASKGKTLNVRTSSPMIVTIDAESYTLDENGQAVVTINGDLPGMGSLFFGINGYDLNVATLIDVLMEEQMNVATPTASIASGSEVPKGTAVYLRCATEGATIYYTLDGSCPCDDTPARKVYDGSPIIINGSMTIKAMATAPDLYDSDVATFVYSVSSEINGDVNRDGEVNIADINVVIDVILSSNVNPDVLARADVNGDGEANIADINVIIDIILSAKSLMAHDVNCDDKIHLDNVTMKPGEVRTMQVTLDNASHYSAMQCDIVLPAGLTLIGTNARGSNVSKMGSIDETSSRALSYSPTKVPFASNGQSILTLTVRADEALEAESEIILTNVVLADAENKAWHLADCKARVNNTSGVNDLTAISNRVWTEDAYLCIESHQNGVARVTTISGIMYEVAVATGITRYELAPGIYVVTINGNSYKIAIK